MGEHSTPAPRLEACDVAASDSVQADEVLIAIKRPTGYEAEAVSAKFVVEAFMGFCGSGFKWRIVESSPAQAPHASALHALIAVCDEANELAVKRLGGYVIDYRALDEARFAATGERLVTFCGGYPHLLRGPQCESRTLEWEASGEPASAACNSSEGTAA